MITPKFEGKVAVIMGTGPSLTDQVVQDIREYRNQCTSPLRTFAVNNVYQKIVPDVFFACNPEWWDYYYPTDPVLRDMLLDGYTDAWTWDERTSERYGLNWIEGRWSGGKRNVTNLSTDPSFIHYGHGSGFEVLGLAYHYGCRVFVLVGYDLRYPRGYDPIRRLPGEGQRHFFGEYPAKLSHFPGSSGKNFDLATGAMTGLLDCYRTIDCERLGLRIINCSPGTALDFFEVGDLEKVLYEIHRPVVPLDPQNAMGLG